MRKNAFTLIIVLLSFQLLNGQWSNTADNQTNGNLTLINTALAPFKGNIIHFTSYNTNYSGPRIRSSLRCAGCENGTWSDLILSSYSNGYKDELTLSNGTITANGDLVVPNGNLGIGSINTHGDKFHVNTGGMYFRVTPGGIGIADGEWQHTLTLSNFSDYSEIFNNDGKTLVLQNKLQGCVVIGSTDNKGDKFHVNTGGQFIRAASWGLGITDDGFQHTLILSNSRDYSEIFNNDGKPIMLQKQSGGNVGIGTNAPDSRYKLDVLGTIRAREIKVDMEGADFVFESNYYLMPLNELEKFIKTQKHLPEIAPASEMKENGTDLGSLNSKLLQKIEEQTLYIIELNNQVRELRKQMDELKK